MCVSGGMVDALVLGTSEVTRGGSSPLPRTKQYILRNLKGFDVKWRQTLLF